MKDPDQVVDARSQDFSYAMAESLLRVSLAGFGGALAGLSHSRRSSVPQRGRPYVDPNLPTSWAMACFTFASILEVSRRTSPTSVLVPNSKPIQTIGDFTFGGAVAGAVFRGMQIRSLPNKLSSPPRMLSGLITGMTLGFLAGVAQYGVDTALEYLEPPGLPRGSQESPPKGIESSKS